MNVMTPSHRVLHQFRAEWRHQHWIVLGWLLWLVLRTGYQHRQARPGVIGYANLESMADFFSLLLAAVLVWRCVSVDSPSNADSFSLTRPVGRGALWVGKLAFLITSLFVPAWLVLSRGWTGFDLGALQWLALSGGVALAAGLTISAVASLSSLAASVRQLWTLAIVGVFAGGVWLALGESIFLQARGPQEISEQLLRQQVCGKLLAGVVVFAGLMISWWMASVPRRRVLAGGIMVAGLATASVLPAYVRTDWVSKPQRPYANAVKLGIKTGKADPADKVPGRGLWSTLRITGLGRDEVASIIDFAPVEGSASWPPLASYTDLPVNTSGWDDWLHHDHTRALFKHSPPTTLWRDHLLNDTLYRGRPALKEIIKPLHLTREQAIAKRWRLRLAIHEMKRVVTVPYRQLWSQPNSFLIRPGVRVEFDAYAWLADAWELRGRVHRNHSSVLAVDAHSAAHAKGRDLSDNFLLVLEDPELRENEARCLNLSRYQGGMKGMSPLAIGWHSDQKQAFEIRMWTPEAQHFLLKTTHDQWVDRLKASLWHAEERGVVEFELSAEQMAEVLEEPKKEEVTKK